MYTSILLSGAVDLAVLRTPGMPHGLDSLALCCAFVAMGLVLNFHLSGPPLDVRLHMLLVLATYGVAAVNAVALLLPTSRVAGFARCVTLLALGSFWIQAGHLMYRCPAFDSNEGVAIAPIIFVAHYAAWATCVFLCLLVALRSGLGHGGASSCNGSCSCVARSHGDLDAPAGDEEVGATPCAPGKCRQAGASCGATKAQD